MNKNYFELESTAKFFRDKAPDILVEKGISEIKSDGKNALDIGCGGGRNSLVLAEHCFDVQILDQNQVMLDTTIRTLLGKQLKVNTAGIQDISSLNIGKDNFDIILCIGVLHQNQAVTSLVESIEKIYKSLKSGGVFVYNVFTSDYTDSSLVALGEGRYQTKENASMLLILKNKYLEIFKSFGFEVIHEQYDLKEVNTGKRSILRGILRKAKD